MLTLLSRTFGNSSPIARARAHTHHLEGFRSRLVNQLVEKISPYLGFATAQVGPMCIVTPHLILVLCLQARPSKRKAVSSECGSDSEYEMSRRTAGRNNGNNKPSYVVPDTDEV